MDPVDANPDSGDGIGRLHALLAAEKAGVRRIDYRQLHRVLAECNFVLAVSEGYRDAVHCAFYDLFRLEDKKIVEHWDTTEAIAPRAEWKNNNGKF